MPDRRRSERKLVLTPAAVFDAAGWEPDGGMTKGMRDALWRALVLRALGARGRFKGCGICEVKRHPSTIAN